MTMRDLNGRTRTGEPSPDTLADDMKLLASSTKQRAR
jgi:hypothetical protein